jgi:hypothetical protein
VVHACWDDGFIEPLRATFPDGCIDQHFLQAAAVPGSFACNVFDRLLRGTDMRLPDGLTLTGGDGLTRSFFRTKFWEEDPKTYGDIVFQPDALPEPVARTPLSSSEKNSLLRYGVDEPCCSSGITGAAANRRRSVRTWPAWITARCCTASWWPIDWIRKPASIRINSSGSTSSGPR